MTTRLSPERARVRAGVFKSLGHPSRIQLLDALSGGEMCVQDLTALVGSDISTVSKHLSVLKNAGLVSVEKRGQNQFYSLRCECLSDFFRCVDSVTAAQSRSLQEACGC